METKKVYELAKYHAEISRQDLERYNRTARGPRVRLETLTAGQAYDLASCGWFRDINREPVATYNTLTDALAALGNRTGEAWWDCYHHNAIIETYGAAAIGIDEEGDEVEWYGEEWACASLRNEFADVDDDEDEDEDEDEE